MAPQHYVYAEGHQADKGALNPLDQNYIVSDRGTQDGLLDVNGFVYMNSGQPSITFYDTGYSAARVSCAVPVVAWRAGPRLCLSKPARPG